MKILNIILSFVVKLITAHAFEINVIRFETFLFLYAIWFGRPHKQLLYIYIYIRLLIKTPDITLELHNRKIGKQ